MSFCENSEIQGNLDNPNKLKHRLVRTVESFILLDYKNIETLGSINYSKDL